MNQTQRKFLLEVIEKQYQKEKRQLENMEPDAPSLNNYLISAILEGTFQMQSTESIRGAITDRVRKLGKSESLVSGKSRYDEEEGTICIPAMALFISPPAYQEAEEEYKKQHEEWSKKMQALEAAIQAMRLKVQIGSDVALKALVDQADQLCSMSLTYASQLMLSAPLE